MSLEFNPNYIDFRQIYENIKPGMLVSFVSINNEKINAIVENIDTKMVLKDTSGNEKLYEFIKEKFIKNDYLLLDFMTDMLMTSYEPDEIFNYSLESIELKIANIETEYITKADWEQRYTMEDQVEDLTKYIIDKKNYNGKNNILVSKQKAQRFGDLIENTRFYDETTNRLLYLPIYNSQMNPIEQIFEKGNYLSELIIPIISDKKQVYENSKYTLTEDPRINFNREGVEKTQLNLLMEIDKQYREATKAELQGVDGVNIINYKQKRILEYDGGILPKKITFDESIHEFEPILPSHISFDNNQYIRYNSSASYDFEVYRNITPLTSFKKGKNRVLYEKRRVRGPISILVDNPNSTLITALSNCQVCRGTAGTAESKYFNKQDKGSSKFFNLSISKEPTYEKYIDGEDISVIGFVYRDSSRISHSFNNLIKNKRTDDSYIIEYDVSTSIVDKVIDSTKNNSLKKNNITVRDNLEGSFNKKKDNFLFFGVGDSILSKEQFMEKVRSIIPNVDKIIESDNMDECNNMTDVSKILGKYMLSFKNINIKQMKKIEKKLNIRYLNYRNSNEFDKLMKQFYIETNKIIQNAFQNIYENCFQLKTEINLTQINNMMMEHLKILDDDIICHIINYYFGVVCSYKNKAESRRLLIKLFFDRYIDYLISENPIRLLIQPLFVIEHKELVPIIDTIKRYYNIDLLHLHLPTEIGILNELYHNMFIKDSLENFNILVEYVYAERSLNKLDNESKFISDKYVSISILEERVTELDELIKKYRREEGTCANYRITKYYSSIDKLNMDNVEKAIKRDRQYSSVHSDISENDFALLIENNSSLYQIFKRLNNKWIFIMDVPEHLRVAPIYEKEKIKNGILVNPTTMGRITNNIDVPILCNMNGNNMKTFNLEENCVSYNNECINRDLISLIEEYDRLINVKKTINNIPKQRQLFLNIINSCNDKIKKIKKINDEELNKKVEYSLSIYQQHDKPIVNERLVKYRALLQQILNDMEEDTRLEKLEIFIRNHGLLNKKIKDGILVSCNIDESHDIFYDIPGVIEKMCCKHWLIYSKQSYKNSDERAILQKTLETKYGIITINGRWIECKNCGLRIGEAPFSELEGFNAEEKTDKFREAINELPNEETVFMNKYSGISYDVFIFLQSISRNYGIELKRHIVDTIIQQSHDELTKKIAGFHIYENHLINRDSAPYAEIGKLYEAGKTGEMPIKLYKKDRDIVFPNIAFLTEDKLVEIQRSDNPISKRLIKGIEMIKNHYNEFVSFHTVITTVARLVVYFYQSMPEIKMYQTGSRESRLPIITNYILNQDITLNLFVKIITDFFKVKLDGRLGEISDGFNKYVKKSLEKTEDRIKTSIQKYIEEFSKYHSIKTALENKMKILDFDKKYRETKDKRSSDWKTFRPVLLEIDKPHNFSNEISKITIESIESNIQSQLTTANPNIETLKLAGFILIYKLFDSIHKIINKSQTVKRNDFANFCCIMKARTNYLDFFKNADVNIARYLSNLDRIEPFVFFNPIQQFPKKYDYILNAPPLLLNYFNEGISIMKDNDLKLKISHLFKTYTFNSSDNIIKRRLLSKYNDPYKSSDLTLHEIREDMTSKGLPHIDDRILNIQENNGLIIEDLTTGLFMWDIEKLIHTNTYNKSKIELIQLYHTLVNNLNKTNKMYENNKSYSRIAFANEYPKVNQLIDSDLNKIINDFENVLDNIRNLIKEDNQEIDAQAELNVRYSEFITLIEGYKSIRSRLSSINPQNLRDEITQVWRNIDTFNMNTLQDMNQNMFKPINDLFAKSQKFNISEMANMEKIEQERLSFLENQILIEGYQLESQISKQHDIRTKYIINEFLSYRTRLLRNYYQIIVEKVSKFKYYNYFTNLVTKFRNIHEFPIFPDNSNIMGEADNIYSNFPIVSFFKNDLYTDNRDKLNRIWSVISSETLSLIQPIQNSMSSINEILRISVFNDDHFKTLILYFMKKTLIGLKKFGQDKSELNEYCDQYINGFILSEISTLMKLNSQNNKTIAVHLRNLITVKSRKRKDDFDKLADEERDQHSLKRSLGLGNFSTNTNVYVENEKNEEEEYNEGDTTHNLGIALISQEQASQLEVDINDTVAVAAALQEDLENEDSMSLGSNDSGLDDDGS